ncbi:hypothetical protein [Mycobacterium sp. C31M]
MHGVELRQRPPPAWKPVVMIYAIGGIPIAYLWWDELRTIDKLPVVTADDAYGHEGEFFRVRDRLASEPVYWAPRGTGRSADNHAGAGVLVDLETGGDALPLAEALSVPDLVGVLKKTIGDPPAAGRVMLLMEYP